MSKQKRYPRTPDGRYFLVNDRLWRCSNPALSDTVRTALVKDLMQARRKIKTAAAQAEITKARADVHAAKVALGERGPVWWEDGAKDVNRHHPKNTPYADWWCNLPKPAGD